MNATETSPSLPGLFALLGQTQQEGLQSLMNPGGEGESFSALMSGLLPAEGQTAATTATPLSPLAMLQTLPQDDQSLPLTSTLTAGATVELPEAGLSDVDDLLGRIREGQQPLPWRMSGVTSVALTTDDSAADQADVPGLTELNDADEEAAALLAMYLPPPAPVNPEQSGTIETAATVAVTGRRGDAATALTAALTDDDAAASQDLSVTTIPDNDAETDSVDFFLPDSASRGDKSPVTTQAALAASQAQITPSAPTALSAAITAAQIEASDDQSAPLQVADTASQSSESTDLLSSGRLAARDKLDFGQDRREWGGSLGARIVTMVAEDVQQARIQLDPPELGSLEIKLHMNQDQASVQVQAQNPQVREVLEASAHRLRDALAAQGLTLSGFDVSDHSQAQAGQQGEQSQGDGSQGWAADSGETAEITDQVATNSHALLDTFA